MSFYTFKSQIGIFVIFYFKLSFLKVADLGRTNFHTYITGITRAYCKTYKSRSIKEYIIFYLISLRTHKSISTLKLSLQWVDCMQYRLDTCQNIKHLLLLGPYTYALLVAVYGVSKLTLVAALDRCLFTNTVTYLGPWSYTSTATNKLLVCTHVQICLAEYSLKY